MLKNFSKLLCLLIIIFTIFSISICYSTNNSITNSEILENTEASSSETTNTTSTDNIHYGNLYLVGSNVVLDKTVYGSAFIIGNTVEITGQIENDLYVIANTLKVDSSLNNGGFVQGKIYALANSIYFNGACSYLNSISNNIDMTYDSFIFGNAKIISSNATILSAISRDLELLCTNASFIKDSDSADILGNLNYASINNIEIPESIVRKNITKEGFISSLHNYSFKNIIFSTISTIIAVLLLHIIFSKFTTNFAEKLSNINLSPINILKSLGIGLLLIIIFVIIALLTFISVLILKTHILAELGFILILLFGILYFISVPVLSIVIAKKIATILPEKKYLFLLVLSLTSIGLYGLTLIPIAGLLLSVIIKLTAMGSIIYIYLPSHKKLIDEENTTTTQF